MTRQNTQADRLRIQWEQGRASETDAGQVWRESGTQNRNTHTTDRLGGKGEHRGENRAEQTEPKHRKQAP